MFPTVKSKIQLAKNLKIIFKKKHILNVPVTYVKNFISMHKNQCTLYCMVVIIPQLSQLSHHQRKICFAYHWEMMIKIIENLQTCVTYRCYHKIYIVFYLEKVVQSGQIASQKCTNENLQKKIIEKISIFAGRNEKETFQLF